MEKKTLILIASNMVVLLVVIVCFTMTWSKISNIEITQNKGAEEAAGEDKEEGPSIGPIFPLETFIVNLADPGGERYLRVTMKLEYDKKTLGKELKERLPQIRDKILRILPTRTVSEVQSAEGKIALRKEIISALNSILEKGRVTSIYFSEFVIQ